MLLLSDEDDFDVRIEWAPAHEVAHVVNRASLKPIFNKEEIEHAQVQENAGDDCGAEYDYQDFQESHLRASAPCQMRSTETLDQKVPEEQSDR
jgi:hypothetical protein